MKTSTNPASVTSRTYEEAQCKKQEDTCTSQRRLNNVVHNNIAYDGGAEVEGVDVSDDEDDSYQPITATDTTVTDLSNLIHQLRLNSVTRSREAGLATLDFSIDGAHTCCNR